MTIAWLRESYNVERVWESMVMRHSSVVLRGCLKAYSLYSLWLGHSGLSAVWNATGTHSFAAPAFLYQSLSAAPRLIRCRDHFPVRLKLTAQLVS